jgi:hypothetical protein
MRRVAHPVEGKERCPTPHCLLDGSLLTTFWLREIPLEALEKRVLIEALSTVATKQWAKLGFGEEERDVEYDSPFIVLSLS